MATNRCQHRGCGCETRAGQQYCSDHCATAQPGASPLGCGCGHARCQSR